MSPRPRRAIVLAPKGNLDLLGSYARALTTLGWEVTEWSFHDALARNVRFGRIGRTLSSFVNVEPWVIKANRELIVLARELQADLILAAGAMPVRPGALAQIRVSVPNARSVLLWPDPLQNLSPPIAQALPVYDLVVSYSRVAMPAIRQLGACEVLFLPFAADPKVFPPDAEPTASDRAKFTCDVIFVGNYRPERERALNALHRAGLSVKVFGERTWLRFARERSLVQKYFEGRPLYGAEMVRAVKCASVCLNVIDDTNYPAANMRSFEGPTCGGAMLQTRAPELEPLMPEGVATLYFDDDQSMIEKARWLVAHPRERAAIAAEGQRIAVERHTYIVRAREMLAALEHAADRSLRHEALAKS